MSIYHINPVQPLCVSRLPSFIRLVDYLVVSTLHTLVVNAVAKLLAVFQEQVGRTPSHAIIQSWGQQPETATEAAEEEIDKKVGHCFSTIKNKATVIVIFTESASQSDTDLCAQFLFMCLN